MITGMWAFDGIQGEPDQGADWTSLEEGIGYLLNTLWLKKELIAQYASSAQLIWWCGHFQDSFDGGPTLSSTLLQRLGEFGADLYIDNYLSPPRGE